MSFIISSTQANMLRQNLAWMHSRAPDGKLSLRADGHLNKRPLWTKDPADIKSTFNAGGAGCFAKPAEYCQIIATLDRKSVV